MANPTQQTTLQPAEMMASPYPNSDGDPRPVATEVHKKTVPNMSLQQRPIQPSRLQDLRRVAALGFIHQIGQCRLALKYSVIGWTGTLDQDKIPNALLNAPSITQLNSRMDGLERALAPFLPHGPDRKGLDADGARCVEHVRDRLLQIVPGIKSTRFVVPVLDEIEAAAREARLLPPEDRCGWAWSWGYDDWFRWDAAERKWRAAADPGLKIDFLM